MARGEIILFTDMDQSTPISELNKLFPWYKKGFNVVIGSRGAARDGATIIRKAGSAVFRAIRHLIILGNINDTQCGFKTCLREAALEVFPLLQCFKKDSKPLGWKVSAYDVELLYIFEKKGYSIKEVEVNWKNRDLSETKGNIGGLYLYIKESIEMAEEIIRVKFNQLTGKYDSM